MALQGGGLECRSAVTANQPEEQESTTIKVRTIDHYNIELSYTSLESFPDVRRKYVVQSSIVLSLFPFYFHVFCWSNSIFTMQAVACADDCLIIKYDEL